MFYDDDTMTFGMAFSRIGMSPVEIGDYLSFSAFSAMELPWEAFTDSDPETAKIRKEAARSGRTVICGSLMDSRLSRGILFAEDKFQKDFSIQLANALQFLVSNGIRTATLDCPLENVLSSQETQNDLRKILLGAAPVIVREKMTLLLPCSIPAAGQISSALQFMRNTMIPSVKLKLDLMPWHPEYMKKTVSEQLGSLLLETGNVTFRYDADCGNRIMKEQVQTVITELKKVNFTGTVLLAPMSQGNRMAYPEACQFSGILEELKDFIES
ncbi:MAG: hypothetical protein IJW07_05240 [Lentisphaeria bacterium]|nr:hypothetical protein [Lentisphaeria bacterium]